MLHQTIWGILLITAGLLPACNSRTLAQTKPIEASAVDIDTSSHDDGEPVVIGYTHRIKSTVYGDERTLSVRLPYDYTYDPTASFPVVYIVDGGPEQDFPHLAGMAQIRDVNYTIGPFILVGIETINRRQQITPPVIDPTLYEMELEAKPGGSAEFRDFIRLDVMPWVNAKYRSSGHTAIMGESAAGLFIIETLFVEPALFNDYIAVTPSLWWEDMKYGREAVQYLQNIPTGKRRLYIASADEGYKHQGGIDRLVDALKTDAPEGLLWRYYAKGDTQTHGSIYHGAALEALRIMFPETTRYGQPGELLSGSAPTPRTAQQNAIIEQECTVSSAIQFTPADTRDPEIQAGNLYKCLVYQYGPVPNAGNMTMVSSPQ